MYFEREHRLSKPRPLNPDLNVHMDFSPLYPSSMLPNSYPNPAESTDFASAQPKEFPSKSKRRDFQLAVIPSSDDSDSPVLDDLSSSRSPSLLEIQDTQPSSDINSFLEECGLPPLDFLQMTYENKDFVVRATGSFNCSINPTFACWQVAITNWPLFHVTHKTNLR